MASAEAEANWYANDDEEEEEEEDQAPRPATGGVDTAKT